MTDTNELSARLGAALGPGYTVDRALGEGGFAVVFLVRDLTLKRSLAVKVLSPDMITSKSVLERFRREAETVAQLSHPNIVPLHFIGQQDDLLYLAMQYIDGGSIADRLRYEPRLPITDAVRIISEVATALAYAHRRGVIHRDIKPANILVDVDSGRCLVTDFGIARTADSAALTATGMMIGTAAYLSPEQVTGEAMDHRVDIFALGAMAYEMIAGRLPFEAPTPSAALMKRLGAPPAPLGSVRDDVSPALSDVVGMCLAASPAERFQSAADVVRALGGDVVTTGGRKTRAIPLASARVPWLRLVIGAGGVVAIAVATWLASHSRTPPRARNTDKTESAMVNIPAGEYFVGSDSPQSLSDHSVTRASPRHAVHIDAFVIDRTEVTVAAFTAYVDSMHIAAPWGAAEPRAALPVTRVPWAMAGEYCTWKHDKRGRLPSEEEWEAAAGGTAGREFAWGNNAGAGNANTASAGRAAVVPVGSFPLGATPEGVLDMIGNAWEWTSSALRGYPGGVTLHDSLARNRVIRGGAFDTVDSVATTWKRGYFPEQSAPVDLPKTGFRCVVSTAAP